MSIDQGRHSLGVDFGTSNTVAVARWPDGRARPILVDGSPLLPSAVYAEPNGHLAVGRDAVHNARRDPARFEPNPKRRIDDGLVLLGEEEFAVVDLIAAVLVRVADEWHRAVGPVRPELTLTCPATWGAARRSLLAEAAAIAGLERARLVAEPVAAATYFAEVLGRDVPIGSVVVVHDFGAGTFDASVVARTAEGFEVLAVDGRDDLGGLDVDAAIVDHLGKQVAERDAAVWQRLSEPETVEDRRAKQQLWEDVRIAKERLSRIQSADVVVPLLDLELHVTRDELEDLARPLLEQTVQVTRDLLRWADLPEGRLAGVFLVGGASRIPLVATLLHRELGEAPVAIEQPELVVAEGSILADAALLATEPAAPGPTAEMRLVSRNNPLPPRGVTIDDMETVPSSRTALRPPDPNLPPPAVDPWPDAQQHWTPDPDQTVASEPSWDVRSLHNTPVPEPGTSPSGGFTPGKASTKTTGTVTSRPVSPPTRPVSGAARPASGAARPASGAARPVSGAARPVSGARPGSTARWAPAPAPASDARPAARPKRRPSRLLRFLQILLSILFLIAAPLIALVAAYSVSAQVPMDSAAQFLLDDLSRLLG
ncbi:Hsp70 family protein [Actinoplanes friuliensis]|uniref:Heat shock protein 70 n=1 Tax=Actinoplanes friuliensis DSM 7358 TaxID=1246995 RepID=U5WCE1_9ACTN|nr:Hsp70 family protein [Actinoplanes friuliensis]AGZ45665.1 heat shock protein 70 [Actinoplanes friuliensis DSM 7358]